MQYFEAQRRRGGKLIVVDPRKSATAKLASLHLQITPGTDAALANGLLNVAINHRLIDDAFIAARTTGFDRVRRIVASYWPDRVERITGVPARRIEEAAHIMGEAATAMVLTGRGPEQQSHGVDNVLAFINLALALGKAGKPFCGYGCLTGQGNGQGGREHGQKADQLPGYRKLDNPRHRAEIAAIWGIDPDDLPRPGLSAVELLAALGTSIRGLLVFASNIAISAPAAVQLGARLDALDMLVVADFFLSETAAQADVVLPVAQWAEEEGTMTNLEGRVLLRRRVQAPPEGVWTDAQVLKALADRLGAGRHFSADTRAMFEEFRRATSGGTADYAGITYERIVARGRGVLALPGRKPSRHAAHVLRTLRHRRRTRPLPSGRVHAGRRSSRRGLPVFPDHRARAGAVPVGHPDPPHQGAGQGRAGGVRGNPSRHRPRPRHPAGDKIRLTTRRGRAVMKARLTPDIRLDTVFAPFHWGGGGSANALTNPALDPVSRIPEFKVCAVRVEKVAAPAAARAQVPASTLSQ